MKPTHSEKHIAHWLTDKGSLIDQITQYNLYLKLVFV